MLLLKRLLVVIQIIVITITLPFSVEKTYAQIINQTSIPVKAAVFFYSFNDFYDTLLKTSFEEIQKNNEGKIEFTFYDGNKNQDIQDNSISDVLNENKADVLLVNLVSTPRAQEVINIIKEYNVPVIFFNRQPNDMSTVQSYGNAYYVGTDPPEPGILEGNILGDAWIKNKQTIDKNNDDILQYIMLVGQRDDQDAIARTKYSVSTINDMGVRTQELAATICNWTREEAKANFEPLFLYYGNSLEAVISNNDEMAIGAIEILQKYGYNTGDSSKMIPVVGIDAIPPAQELIKKGEMLGSVVQNQNYITEISYNIAMNLANGKAPLDGTNYKFDSTGVAVRIPCEEYLK